MVIKNSISSYNIDDHRKIVKFEGKSKKRKKLKYLYALNQVFLVQKKRKEKKVQIQK